MNLGFLKVGAPLDIEISNFTDIKGNAYSDLTTIKFIGSVKDALEDSDAAAIQKINSVDHPHRFEFSNSNATMTIQMLTAGLSEQLVNNLLTVEDTNLCLYDMPIIGYIYVDIWAQVQGGSWGQILFDKIPVVRPTTISKQ